MLVSSSRLCPNCRVSRSEGLGSIVATSGRLEQDNAKGPLRLQRQEPTLCGTLRRPMLDPRFRMLALVGFLLACQRSTPTLEQRAEQQAARDLAEAFNVPIASMPAAGPPPSGINSELWTDLHWLPASALGITGARTPSALPMLQVVRQLYPQSGECSALERGIEAAYQIETAKNASTHVLIGQFKRADVEACSGALVASLGGTHSSAEGRTVFRVGDAMVFMSMAHVGERMFAVVSDHVDVVDALKQPTANRLTKNRVLGLLRRVERTGQMWVVSTRDFASGLVGVAGEGMVLSIHGVDPERMSVQIKGQLVFADSQTAQQASQKTGDASSRIQAALETKLQPETLVVDNAITFALAVPTTLFADGRIEQALAKLSMQTDTGLDGKAALEPPAVAE